MPINKKNAYLKDLYEFQYGKGNTIENTGGEFPIYGSNGIVGYTNKFNSENAPVIGHIGAYAGIVNWANGKHYVTYNGVICNVRNGNDSRFGFYTLLVSKLQSKLRGSTQPFVSYDLLNDVKIFLPELIFQQKIGKVLSDLDAKIELNNKINAELETMAKLIYDYWFVQFEFPNENGKPFKSSGGKMVWNEELKRELPEGWKNGYLNSIGDIIGGSTPSKAVDENFCQGTGMPWITPKDLSMNKGKKYITRGEWDVSEKGLKEASLKIMPKGTVLLSSRAPIGYLAIARTNVTTNQGFKSFVPKENFSTEFIYYTVMNLIPEIEANSSGSTFQEVSTSTLRTIKTVLPTLEILSLFDKKIKPIFSQQNVLEEQNQKLAELRDWLLPMLMNGQVKIN
jgi:type I restriction enzyme S subunit